jgi:hypothetical protein
MLVGPEREHRSKPCHEHLTRIQLVASPSRSELRCCTFTVDGGVSSFEGYGERERIKSVLKCFARVRTI